jgi:hypothetical protein
MHKPINKRFVDIGEIVDHNCLQFLSIKHFSLDVNQQSINRYFIWGFFW